MGLLRSVYEDHTWLEVLDNCCLRDRPPLCVCPDEAPPLTTHIHTSSWVTWLTASENEHSINSDVLQTSTASACQAQPLSTTSQKLKHQRSHFKDLNECTRILEWVCYMGGGRGGKRERSNGELASSEEESISNLLKTPDPCTLNEV